MDPWMAIVLVALFGIGLGCGIFMGRNKDDSGDKIKQLQGDLEQAKVDMDAYRKQVGEHFGQTAELFNKMTSDYRDLYQHLAGGAQQLCDSSVPQIRSLTADDGKAVLEGSAKHHAEETVKPAPTVAEKKTAPAETETQSKADEKTESVAPNVSAEKETSDRSDAARTIH